MYDGKTDHLSHGFPLAVSIKCFTFKVLETSNLVYVIHLERVSKLVLLHRWCSVEEV